VWWWWYPYVYGDQYTAAVNINTLTWTLTLIFSTLAQTIYHSQPEINVLQMMQDLKNVIVFPCFEGRYAYALINRAICELLKLLGYSGMSYVKNISSLYLMLWQPVAKIQRFAIGRLVQHGISLRNWASQAKFTSLRPTTSTVICDS